MATLREVNDFSRAIRELDAPFREKAALARDYFSSRIADERFQKLQPEQQEAVLERFTQQYVGEQPFFESLAEKHQAFVESNLQRFQENQERSRREGISWPFEIQHGSIKEAYGLTSQEAADVYAELGPSRTIYGMEKTGSFLNPMKYISSLSASEVEEAVNRVKPGATARATNRQLEEMLLRYGFAVKRKPDGSYDQPPDLIDPQSPRGGRLKIDKLNSLSPGSRERNETERMMMERFGGPITPEADPLQFLITGLPSMPFRIDWEKGEAWLPGYGPEDDQAAVALSELFLTLGTGTWFSKLGRLKGAKKALKATGIGEQALSNALAQAERGRLARLHPAAREAVEMVLKAEQRGARVGLAVGAGLAAAGGAVGDKQLRHENPLIRATSWAVHTATRSGGFRTAATAEERAGLFRHPKPDDLPALIGNAAGELYGFLSDMFLIRTFVPAQGQRVQKAVGDSTRLQRIVGGALGEGVDLAVASTLHDFSNIYDTQRAVENAVGGFATGAVFGWVRNLFPGADLRQRMWRIATGLVALDLTRSAQTGKLVTPFDERTTQQKFVTALQDLYFLWHSNPHAKDFLETVTSAKVRDKTLAEIIEEIKQQKPEVVRNMAPMPLPPVEALPPPPGRQPTVFAPQEGRIPPERRLTARGGGFIEAPEEVALRKVQVPKELRPSATDREAFQRLQNFYRQWPEWREARDLTQAERQAAADRAAEFDTFAFGEGPGEAPFIPVEELIDTGVIRRQDLPRLLAEGPPEFARMGQPRPEDLLPPGKGRALGLETLPVKEILEFARVNQVPVEGLGKLKKADLIREIERRYAAQRGQREAGEVDLGRRFRPTGTAEGIPERPPIGRTEPLPTTPLRPTEPVSRETPPEREVGPVEFGSGLRFKRTERELLEAIEKHRNWADWYERHGPVLDRIFGEDAGLFTDILAATSQRQTVKGNVTSALKAYRQMKLGKPFEGHLAGVKNNLERIRSGEATQGAKISAFQAANRGIDRPAIDRHVAWVLFGTNIPTARQIKAAERKIERLAPRAGLNQKETQAALWAFGQVLKGKDPERIDSYASIVEERADEIAALRSAFDDVRGAGEGLPGRGEVGRPLGPGEAEPARAPGTTPEPAVEGEIKPAQPGTPEVPQRTSGPNPDPDTLEPGKPPPAQLGSGILGALAERINLKEEKEAVATALATAYRREEELISKALLGDLTEQEAVQRGLGTLFTAGDVFSKHIGDQDMVSQLAFLRERKDRNELEARVRRMKGKQPKGRGIVGEARRTLEADKWDFVAEMVIRLRHSENRFPGRGISRAQAAARNLRREDKAFSVDIANVIDLAIQAEQGRYPEIREYADRIEQELKDFGISALDAGAIGSTIEHYAPRYWVPPTEKEFASRPRFGQKTGHAKQRVFDDYFQGLDLGYRPRIRGLSKIRAEVMKDIGHTLTDRELVEISTTSLDPEGKPLWATETEKGDNYERLKHPGFYKWVHAGSFSMKATKEGLEYAGDWGFKRGIPQGLAYIDAVDQALAARIEKELTARKWSAENVFMTHDGESVNVFRKADLYAPKIWADFINRIYSPSKFHDPNAQPYWQLAGKGLRGLYALKSLLFAYGYFHHQALSFSWWLGTDKTGAPLTEKVFPWVAARHGYEAATAMEPVIRHGISNGLTLWNVPDWDPTVLGKRRPVSFSPRESPIAHLAKLRDEAANSLFQKFQTGLKAKAFALEYGEAIKRFTRHNGRAPTFKEQNEIAKRRAQLVNADYGGLHWRRIGRSQTMLDLERFLLLAPDWTESNLRYVPFLERLSNRITREGLLMGEAGQNTFGDVRGMEGMDQIYTKFYSRALAYGVVSTIMANVAINGWDDTKKRFGKKTKEALKTGKYLTLLKTPAFTVDLTKVYDAMGIKQSGDRPFKRRGTAVTFKLIKQFADPMKFILSFLQDGVVPWEFLRNKAGIGTSALIEFRDRANWAGMPYLNWKDALRYGHLTAPHRFYPQQRSKDILGTYLADQLLGILPIPLQNAVQVSLGELDMLTGLLLSSGAAINREYPPPGRHRPKRHRRLYYRD